MFKRHWIVLYLAFIALFRIFYPSLYLSVRQLLLTVCNSTVVLDMTGQEKLLIPIVTGTENGGKNETYEYRTENRKPKTYMIQIPLGKQFTEMYACQCNYDATHVVASECKR